ncbi:MAG: AbrB/MazE/SpoVT family DNA-binding domain-containing protein [Deltaproteobacteria bacterium]|nr:AbrB/MazE/SpoVT family DNA-binding domain-containing protein [Deltaproteobacteria bacterium]
MAAVKSSIVQIGNSRGIRIPKALLAQCRLEGEVELVPEGDRLVIRSASRPRRGWEDAFAAMAEKGDDRLLEGDAVLESSWDEEQWEWS